MLGVAEGDQEIRGTARAHVELADRPLTALGQGSAASPERAVSMAVLTAVAKVAPG